VKSKRYIIPLVVVLVAPVVIFYDIKTGLFAGRDLHLLNHYSRLISKIGMMLFSAVFAFYVIKTYLLIMRKKSFTHKGLVLLQYLVALLRKIHPFAGAIALALLAVHGFIFIYRIYAFEVNLPVVTGTLAFIAFFFTGIFGIALYRKLAHILVRKIHRYMAFIVLVLVIAHVLLPD
jgi:hypothetical protein